MTIFTCYSPSYLLHGRKRRKTHGGSKRRRRGGSSSLAISARPRDGSSNGWLVQGMARPRDGSSKGWLVQGMARPRDGSSKEPVIRDVSFGGTPVGDKITFQRSLLTLGRFKYGMAILALVSSS
jgi:hypothetical protein